MRIRALYNPIVQNADFAPRMKKLSFLNHE